MTTVATNPKRLPLNERIVWARKRIGVSQERLAEMAGTTRRHMIRVEKGYHRPGPELRARIAAATEQPESLFEDDDEEVDRVVDLDVALRSYLRRLIREEVRS